VSVVLPTYQEGRNILDVLPRVEQALAGEDYEVVVVDDDSPDGTGKLAEGYARSHPRVRVFRLIGRAGLSGSVMHGFDRASGEALAVMDADLSHDERLLPQMLARLRAGADIAVGSRRVPGGGAENWPWFRRSMSTLATWLARAVLPRPLSDPMSGFFMVRREVYERARPRMQPRGYKILLELVARAHPVIVAELPFVFKDRRSGYSKLSPGVAMHYLASVAGLAFGGGPGHEKVRALYLRGLALVYLAAFASLWPQIGALIGAEGILPAGPFLKAVREAHGADAYRLLPTLCWLNAGDGFLRFLCGGGAALSVLALFGVMTGPIFAALWAFYLSLVSVGRDFLGFQWDALLLEAGFLAILWGSWRPRGPRSAPAALWLHRWLVFRLMVSSGLVKLASGDPAWRDLSALTFHYETQPLPTWIGWFAHQLPPAAQKLSAVGMFAAELAVPLLIFGPRRFRAAAAAALAGLQLVIAATGNYGFFNLLTLVLCLTLLDDGHLAFLARKKAAPPPASAPCGAVRRWSFGLLAAALVFLGLVQTLGRFVPAPAGLFTAVSWAAPFRLASPYGLFAVMTTVRPEIVVEGSADGRTWKAYEFKWKPGDPAERPRFVAPHQPRLDWQMWFAALGRYQDNAWYMDFLARLLQGSPGTLGLLAADPFPDGPPRFVRGVLYVYEMTTLSERRETGAWWKREAKGLYSPPVSLRR
jgi:lipase maturation factor 1